MGTRETRKTLQLNHEDDVIDWASADGTFASIVYFNIPGVFSGYQVEASAGDRTLRVKTTSEPVTVLHRW
jgi:hypothetical protein